MTVVHVPMSEAADQIRALLKASQELGLDPTTTVKTSTDGIFGFSLIVPDEVYSKAFLPDVTSKDPDEPPKPKNKGGRPRKVAVTQEDGDE